MRLPHIIPWYRIYSEAVDAAWLTSVIIRHADAISAAARQVAAVLAAEKQREVLRFETITIDGDGADGGNDDDDDSVGSVASDDSVSANLNNAARRVFRVRALRPKQLDAVRTIVYHNECDGKLIGAISAVHLNETSPSSYLITAINPTVVLLHNEGRMNFRKSLSKKNKKSKQSTAASKARSAIAPEASHVTATKPSSSRDLIEDKLELVPSYFLHHARSFDEDDV